MDKKVTKIAVCVIALAALTALYFFASDKIDDNNDTVEENTEENDFKLIQKSSADVINLKLNSADGILEFNKGDVSENGDIVWNVKGYEDYIFNQDNINSLIKNSSELTADDLITDSPENLGDYGLNPPQSIIKVKFSDNTERTVSLGNKTSDNSFYYVSVDGDNSVYIIDQYKGNTFKYSLNNIISKDIPVVQAQKILYLDIIRKDMEEIEIKYVEDKQGNAAELEKYGMQTMQMFKPIDGIAVYPSNLQTTVLSTLSSLQIDELIEIAPQDYSKYGLDNPILKVNMYDDINKLNLIIGNDINESSVYCMIEGRPHIFSIDKSLIQPFIDADYMQFIEKFVALNYRTEIDQINISSANGNYNISFKEESTESTTEESTGDSPSQDLRTPYVNDKKIDNDTFSKFYELLIGITFDNIVDGVTVTGNPEVTIEYFRKDGTTEKVNFYEYNENFYAAEKNGDTRRIVNKQSVNAMLSQAAEISK